MQGYLGEKIMNIEALASIAIAVLAFLKFIYYTTRNKMLEKGR